MRPFSFLLGLAVLSIALLAGPADASVGIFSRARVVVPFVPSVQIFAQPLVVAQPVVQAVQVQPIVQQQFVQPQYQAVQQFQQYQQVQQVQAIQSAYAVQAIATPSLAFRAFASPAFAQRVIVPRAQAIRGPNVIRSRTVIR